MTDNNISPSPFTKITQDIIKFRDARDWKQFHNAKDLSAALSIEASELQELFLWKNGDEVDQTISGHTDRLAEELADVGMYLLLLAEATGLDLAECIEKKLKLNEEKYPVAKSKGKSTKYDKL